MIELIRFAMKVAQTSPFTDTLGALFHLYTQSHARLESNNSPLLGPDVPTDSELSGNELDFQLHVCEDF